MEHLRKYHKIKTGFPQVMKKGDIPKKGRPTSRESAPGLIMGTGNPKDRALCARQSISSSTIPMDP
jgi:hypothetical protein